MSPDPSNNLPQDDSKGTLNELISLGLGDLTLRQVLGEMLSGFGTAQRSAFLKKSPNDKANGTYPRSVLLGSIPLSVNVARTRSGSFRPTLLPPLYQRGFPEESENLISALLASSRSLQAAKSALHKLGLSVDDDDFDSIASEFAQELELRNSRPVDPDLLAIFLDGKFVEIRDGDRLRPACIYLVIGLGRDGKKRVLTCQTFLRRENLEDWRTVLRGLIERGLRRVLLVVQDDFSGLLPISKGLFPNADVQLCIVHMQRNAQTHLGKEHASDFNRRLRVIKGAYDEELAAQQFEELCALFESHAPAFIAELRKKRPHYLAFLRFPEAIRRSFSTTNAVEAINGQLEKIRRLNGGYFHGDDILKVKLGMAVQYLENGKWLRVAASVNAALQQLNALFDARFEKDS